jgi:hypothetical protein
MEKEFILYEQALALKELGFDEPCFGYYLNKKLNIFHNTSVNDRINSKTKDIFKSDVIVTPLYQQAFRFFREEYELDCSFEDEIVFDDDENEIELWNFFIYKSKQVDDKVMKFCSNNSKTYIECFSKEEAELECLKKLIQIVKERK